MICRGSFYMLQMWPMTLSVAAYRRTSSRAMLTQQPHACWTVPFFKLGSCSSFVFMSFYQLADFKWYVMLKLIVNNHQNVGLLESCIRTLRVFEVHVHVFIWFSHLGTHLSDYPDATERTTTTPKERRQATQLVWHQDRAIICFRCGPLAFSQLWS